MSIARDKLHNFCKEHNLDIIYASLTGSKLYGTELFDENGKSLADLDIKCIFLPKAKDLLLQKAPKHFSYTSGKEFSKNTNVDVDIEAWSLHNFLHMVAAGDAGALDLLFSYTNLNAVLYTDSRWEPFINNINSLYNPTNTRAFLGYCLGQIKKYSLKGKRLNALENLIQYVDNIFKSDSEASEKRLKEYFNDILYRCSVGTYIKEDYTVVVANSSKHIRALRVLGSLHLESITLLEFYNRLQSTYKKYGVRSHKAAIEEGIDWKAIHHGVRCAIECKTLLIEGKLTFPLKESEFLIKIKQGLIPFEEITDWLDIKIDEIDYILNQPGIETKNTYNEKLVESLILSNY